MKRFAVVGLGQFGYHVALSLAKSGASVLAIDQSERRVDEVKQYVEQAVCMDATSEERLRAVGLMKVDVAILALGEKDLEASILCCAALADLGLSQIVVRAANPLQARILERVGATRMVFPEKEMGESIARSVLMSGVLDQVELSTGQTVAQIRPRRDVVGMTLLDARLRQRFAINVIGIQKPTHRIDDEGRPTGEHTLINAPGPETVVEENDILIVVGDNKTIQSVARRDD